MREFKPKKDAQKESYYKDRFFVAPKIPREAVSDAEFSACVSALGSAVRESYVERGCLVVWVDFGDVFFALEKLKELEFDVLNELSAIDYLEQKGGFEVFYQLLSMTKKRRVRVKTFLRENERLESVSSLFASANWAEREMFDMFGILPLNHPYPKRILMPDDWVGHPLRKSYPLEGDEAAQWYEVDAIFGKEHRDVIGPEQRDAARIDRYDSKRFSHLGYEVGFGEEITPGSEVRKPIAYQEDGGVAFVKTLKSDGVKELKERK